MPEPRLNPDIRDLDIGVRELRTITIYPLSFRDQEKVTAIIKDTLSAFGDVTKTVDLDPETGLPLDSKQMLVELVTFVISAIESNLEGIVKLTLADEKGNKDIFKEITNNQMIRLCEIIYEVNYDFLSKVTKKAIRMWTGETQMEETPGTPLSPKSAERITTRLKTSMENLS